MLSWSELCTARVTRICYQSRAQPWTAATTAAVDADAANAAAANAVDAAVKLTASNTLLVCIAGQTFVESKANATTATGRIGGESG